MAVTFNLSPVFETQDRNWVLKFEHCMLTADLCLWLLNNMHIWSTDDVFSTEKKKDVGCEVVFFFCRLIWKPSVHAVYLQFIKHKLSDEALKKKLPVFKWICLTLWLLGKKVFHQEPTCSLELDNIDDNSQTDYFSSLVDIFRMFQ